MFAVVWEYERGEIGVQLLKYERSGLEREIGRDLERMHGVFIIVGKSRLLSIEVMVGQASTSMREER